MGPLEECSAVDRGAKMYSTAIFNMKKSPVLFDFDRQNFQFI